jgi:hypothetical protein
MTVRLALVFFLKTADCQTTVNFIPAPLILMCLDSRETKGKVRGDIWEARSQMNAKVRGCGRDIAAPTQQALSPWPRTLNDINIGYWYTIWWHPIVFAGIQSEGDRSQLLPIRKLGYICFRVFDIDHLWDMCAEFKHGFRGFWCCPGLEVTRLGDPQAKWGRGRSQWAVSGINWAQNDLLAYKLALDDIY